VRPVPCNDVTEVIDLALDGDDRLRAYALNKRTCGAEIGDAALLAEWLVGTPAPDILALTGEDVVARYAPPSAEEFLYFKHLVAVQEALRVLTGGERGAPVDACVTVSVAAEADGGVAFVGHLEVPLLAEKIRACGSCGSCGSR
jgi:hypothetical protein